jgi:Leucine-rich repeat (LRR) protein
MVTFVANDNLNVKEFLAHPRWQKLTKLTLSRTNISELPFQNFSALTELHVTQARLTSIPFSVSMCPALKVLNATSNQISFVSMGTYILILKFRNFLPNFALTFFTVNLIALVPFL